MAKPQGKSSPERRKIGPAFESCMSERGVATRELIERIGDKWSLLLVIAISRQPDQRARFSELKKGIAGISQTMLTATLRDLERDGILVREVFAEVPPRVEYQLTPFGQSLLEPILHLAEWAGKNWSTARRSREKFDSHAGKK